MIAEQCYVERDPMFNPFEPISSLIKAARDSINLYLGYSRSFEVMLAALQNSKVITDRGWQKEAGIYGRFMLVSFVGSVLMLPHVHLRRGHLSPHDVLQVPRRIRMWLFLSNAIMFSCFVWGVINWVLLKLAGH